MRGSEVLETSASCAVTIACRVGVEEEVAFAWLSAVGTAEVKLRGRHWGLFVIGRYDGTDLFLGCPLWRFCSKTQRWRRICSTEEGCLANLIEGSDLGDRLETSPANVRLLVLAVLILGLDVAGSIRSLYLRVLSRMGC